MIEKLNHEIEMSYGARRGITQDDIVDKINEIIDYLNKLDSDYEDHLEDNHNIKLVREEHQDNNE